MTAHRSTLRAAHAHATRMRIIDAYVECIEEVPADSVTVTLIADRAGVATRTIYRHFPTRTDLLAGLSEWSLEHFLPIIEFTHLTELPSVYREVARRMDARPQLARALASSQVGREVYGGVVHAVRTLIEAAVDRDLPHLRPARRTQLIALLILLDSAPAWSHLSENFGLQADQVSEAVGWAMTALVAAAANEHDPTSGDI
ncbi:TetR/AcrR family transcriptional regulator [Microbacterium sp. SORGH_AS_0888]|uniref:TetR/AcrR family transcriptional regulator n=1 Tax=Microbacterium sp. SORGH_AS_0888 TaxID=3041791 RepID=UPI00277E0891|nr:TetR/AcrR family transcriptional regulator [Microbacterium sp. SORGH_AS_0888]MDQ1128673.1 AcrR family transcriptional regulator [Microbacterium sp. SORGH_AS_0888]